MSILKLQLNTLFFALSLVFVGCASKVGVTSGPVTSPATSEETRLASMIDTALASQPEARALFAALQNAPGDLSETSDPPDSYDSGVTLDNRLTEWVKSNPDQALNAFTSILSALPKGEFTSTRMALIEALQKVPGSSEAVCAELENQLEQVKPQVLTAASIASPDSPDSSALAFDRALSMNTARGYLRVSNDPVRAQAKIRQFLSEPQVDDIVSSKISELYLVQFPQ